MRPKVVAVVVLALLLIIIMVQNTAAVTLHFLFWTVAIPQVILIALGLLIGFVIGYVASLLSNKKRRV